MNENNHLAIFEVLTADGPNRYRPFGWQKRLLRQLLDGMLPQALDIPTGLGKTSVMALWLIALAARARLPRRLIYVVDRRTVVDQATRYAELLRSNLPAEMATRLGLGGGRPLAISTLRGAFADNRDWLEDPSRPAIVIGTIDMIGSRLLFEGYGVSRRMRPYHAGLLGADALVLLDEAHLCPPFEALLRQIESHRDGKLGAAETHEWITPPFRVMSLSATGRDGPELKSDQVFRLTSEDRDEALVAQRLHAEKRLKVTEPEDDKADLPGKLAAHAVGLGCGEPFSRVLVYCDRRSDAVKVKELIEKECRARRRSGELAVAPRAELLVGERRVKERTDLAQWLEDSALIGDAGEPPQEPVFLVATSAGEVGVDLSADHMVCDLVSWERMVQRLGRVNRRGGAGRKAMVDVYAFPPPEARKEEAKARDFGMRLSTLRKLPVGEDGRHDASPAAIMLTKEQHAEVVRAATTPAPLHPELTRPLLDAWSMTSLRQHEGRPEVGPWLRGWEEEEEPQTSVLWRKHLPTVLSGNTTSVAPEVVSEYFGVAPVHATERLDAGSSRAFDWLVKRSTQVAKRRDDDDRAISDGEIVVIVIDRAGEYQHHLTQGELRRLGAPASSLTKTDRGRRDRLKREWRERRFAGATLVIDARLSGLRAGMLDEKSDDEVPTADADADWRNMEESAARTRRPVIRYRVEPVGSGSEEGGLEVPELEEWRHIRTFETELDALGTARHGLAVFKWHDDAGDEERSVLSAPQSLRGHAEQVAEHVHGLADRLDLPDKETEALVLAARLHDDGKAAERWQSAMNAPKKNRPYAKTAGGGNPRLLEGYRHEFGSLIKAEGLTLPDDVRELILHLIAAHHGFARPLISPAGCEEGPPSLLESKAGEAGLRFARLQKRYGPWGLAWREALLRAADQSASRAWSERHKAP